MTSISQTCLKFLIVGIILFVSIRCSSQSFTINDIYTGKNLFIQNPFERDFGFCTKEVYLDGVKIMENIQSTAYEIDLTSCRLHNSFIVVIKHKSGCEPKLLHSGPISPPNQFYFIKALIERDSFYIETKGESLYKRNMGKGLSPDTLFLDLGNNFYIEKKTNAGWETIGSFAGKESVIWNKYQISVPQLNDGNHLLRIKYVANNGMVFYSSRLQYVKKPK